MTQPKEPYTQQLKLEDFIDNSKLIVKDYICPLCNGIYFNPIIDCCGHIFCEKCLECFDPSLEICPITNTKQPSLPKKVNILITIIEKQFISCSNKGRGCKWEGQVKDYQYHMKNLCSKQFLHCNLGQCTIEVTREDYQSHLNNCDYRSVACEFCALLIPYIQLEKHYNICPLFLVDCPNKCDAVIPREKLDNHLTKDCDYTEIDCSYHSFGCRAKIIKKEMGQHQKDAHDYHLELIFQSLFKKNRETSEQFNQIERKLDALAKLNTSEEEKKKQSSSFNLSHPNAISSNVNLMFLGNKRGREEIITPIIPSPLPTNRGESSNDSIFDLVNFPKGVVHQGNKAKCIITKTDHMFVFFKTPTNINTTLTHWKINFISAPTWVAAGICNREKVIENGGKFYNNNSILNHGAFVLSSNGYLWNTNNQNQNNASAQLPTLKSGDVLDYVYDPSTCELSIQQGNHKEKLTNISGKDLACCIVFLHKETEVEVILDH